MKENNASDFTPSLSTHTEYSLISNKNNLFPTSLVHFFVNLAESPRALAKCETKFNDKIEFMEIVVPPVGESISEVTVGEWVKKNGAYVEKDDVVCELESDKASFEVIAEENGILNVKVNEGETASVGAVIANITPSDPPKNQVSESTPSENGQSSSEPSAEPSAELNESVSAPHAQGYPSAAAAKILREKGVSPTEIEGTGIGGRITKEDAQQVPTASETPQKEKTTTQTTPAPTPSESRSEERQEMSNLRKTIAKRLVSVKNETAMLTTFNEVDMQAVMNLRKAYKESFKEKYDVNLGFMSFFTKAVCLALKEWPAVNAKIDRESIVYHHYCDISIAVSTPKGLVVPVVRNAERLSFQQVEAEILRLALKARDGKLSIEEMTGGTFTITNGGIFGSLLSTPIINAPQSAILGMHNIVPRAVVRNNEIVVRPMMYLALSYDHRIVDGKESVSFLVRVKEYLEDPSRILLGV